MSSPRGARRRVAAIQEGVHQCRYAGGGDGAGEGDGVVLMGMHAAGRDEAHQMAGAAGGAQFRDQLLQGGQPGE